MKSAIKLGEGRRSRGSELGAAGKPGVRDSDGVTFAPSRALPLYSPRQEVQTKVGAS